MLNHLRQRVVEELDSAQSVTLATYGPADIQAGVFPCQADELRLYVLVPRTSDHLFNLEHNPAVVATTESWQLRGVACIAPEPPAGLALLAQPEAAWCQVVLVRPTRLQIQRLGGCECAETIDLD